MPHTLQYRPILIDTLISNERIQSYQTVFHPADDTALMGVYLWNAHVCGAFYPLISAAEVTLRNAIDHALVAGLGRFWWTSGKLHYRSFVAQAQAPHAVKALRENFALATRTPGKPSPLDPPRRAAGIASQWIAASRAAGMFRGGDKALSTTGAYASDPIAGQAGNAG